ncbi:ribbon-helix-helix protein, CopG family [Microcoleus sp. D2_18a_B4]
MKKSIFFRLTDEEFAEIENYCKQTKRTKSDVLRELIRSLKTKKKPSSEGRGLCPISFGHL